MLADKMNTQNDLFDAIYAIATGVVESKNFDITKECKIVEIYTDSKGNRTGIYKVKSQNAVYDAYAKKGENYYTGELVYVQIPNGDFNAQKFILGRKTAEDDGKDTYNFELPFDNFLGLYSLTEYNPLSGEKGFWANCPYHGLEEEISENDLIWKWPTQGEISNKDSIFATRLGVEVDLTTLLHGYAPISGHYGFRIIVSGQGKEDAQITKEYLFTDNDMYGNPYAYTSGSAQQILLNIEDFLQVQSINIYFWQDHNFKDQLGQEIPYGEVDYESLVKKYQDKLKAIEELPDEEKSQETEKILQWYSEESSKTSVLKNIIVNGLNVYLGIIADNKDEQLILYTYNPVKYGADPEHSAVRAKERTLRLAWIHLVDKGVKLINTQDEINQYEAKIYWYKYDETWTPENIEYDESKYPHKFGGLYWRPIDINGELIKTIEPNLDRSRDRFKAVIHYNGTYITSNVLVFTNYFDVDTAKSDLAKNDKVILRCAVLGEDQDGTTRLIDDDSIGNFYVYDENNNVLANDKNELFSNVRYYIEPWIKVTTNTDNTHDGYVRLAEYTDEDGNKPEFSINWQSPENFTMISAFQPLDESVKEESTFFNNCGSTQFALYKKATCWFYIRPEYNMRYANNDIIAEIYIEGIGTCTARKTLLFGRAEAFGAEYVPVISIGIPEGNYYIDTATDFELYCLVYDRKGKLMAEEDRANCKFIWKFISTKPPADNRPHENYKNFQGNVIRGRINEPIPFVVEVTVSGAAAYDLTVRRGIMVCNSATYMQQHDIQCPDRVEFKSDGQQPLWYSAAFEVQTINTETQNILIYPEWKINTTKVLRLIQKDKDYPTFTLSTGEKVSKTASAQYALAFSKQYLTGTIAEPSVYGQQWTDELLEPEYFTYIYYEDKNTGTQVAQAIAFARNLYPSSLVNEWDGQSLSLDEENGAILAKMIAAGTKDAKNRFTGVMMGDWHEKGDESLDVPGLYGFDKGGQSFGFRTDGTGFIGPAGYGRIEFDGNNALISNPEKTCYINLNPRIIGEVNDELWDGIGQQGYSQYFLYCELPQREDAFVSDGEDDLWWRQHSWATPYLQSLEDHDYFIVDPNNGVLTTGGIFARYGQIGTNTPWIIHNNGLTQKNNYGTIFLGNPEKNPSNGAGIPNPGFINEASVENNFFSASFSDSDNFIQTGIRADGYFYTKFAAIGGWFVNDSEIYSSATNSFRKNYNSVGYEGDYINLTANSSRAMMSFDLGNMIINGVEGWMGSLDGGIAPSSPSSYDTFINFRDGFMGFAKNGGIPYTLIDGKNGSAYFAQGKVYIDGRYATIFCGTPVGRTVGGVDILPMTEGAVNLGGMEVYGATTGVSSWSMGGVIDVTGGSGSGEAVNNTISSAEEIIFDDTDAESETGSGASSSKQLKEDMYYQYLATSTISTVSGTDTNLNADGIIRLTENKSGGAYNSSGNGLVVLVGSGASALSPASGTAYLAGDWHLDIKSIYAREAIYGLKSITSNAQMYMTEPSDGTANALVATRRWVGKYAETDIFPRVVTVNNAAAAAMNKASAAMKTANKALKQANVALTEIKNTAVTDVAFETPGKDNGGFRGIKVVVTKGDGTTVETEGVAYAEIHKHNDLLEIKEEGKITFTPGGVVSTSNAPLQTLTIFSGDNGIIFSESGGEITLRLTIAGKTGKKTFNMADTAFYKSAAVESAQIVNVSGAACHITIKFLDGSTKDYATAKLELNEENKKVNLINSAKDMAASIDVSSIYDAGWKAAAAVFNRSGNIIYGPSTTVGSTAQYTAKPSLGGRHTFGFNYASSMYLPKGTFTDANGNSHTLSSNATWYRGITDNCSDSHWASIDWSYSN